MSPLTHLDLEACEALAQGLKQYEGTVMLVSHNRDFLDSVVDRIMEIRPGKADIYYGNYSEWFEKRGHILSSKSAGGNTQKNATAKKRSKEQKRLESEARNQKYKAEKKRQQDLKTLEKRIEEHKKKKQI